MPDALKNFWDKNLEEIRANKIRFAAILILAAATIIFALSDSAASDSEIILDTPAPTPVTETAPVIPISENIIPVLGANSSELYVQDPFKAPVVEVPQPPPAVVEPVTEFLPEIPAAHIPTTTENPKPAEKFLLRGTAITDNFKTALIHKIQNDADKSPAEKFIVSIGDYLDTRRVVDITPNFVALDDGSKIFLTP